MIRKLTIMDLLLLSAALGAAYSHAQQRASEAIRRAGTALHCGSTAAGM